MSATKITESSALVVAHPDDEALWFSSILGQVDRVVICFLDFSSRRDWSEGRRRAISELPLSGVVSLGLTESEAFNCANWWDPEVTDCGLAVSKRPEGLPGASVERYHANFVSLVELLTAALRGCVNVITHNPWGEYGHEEHVQVYRAVSRVQRALGYRVWFSNYCSNKSHNLMLRYLPTFDSTPLTLNTDEALARRLEAVYRANDCWTWPFRDYQWFTEESFTNNESIAAGRTGAVQPYPLNYIRVDAPWDRQQTPGLRGTIGRLVRRVGSRLG